MRLFLSFGRDDGFDAGIGFTLGEAGADEVSGSELGGALYERAIGTEDERITALENGNGR